MMDSQSITGNSRSRSETRRAVANRRDYLLGIGLLLLVVLLWTSSNFITQDLFEGGYEKPFLVTYLNTSAFAFYLLPCAVRYFMRGDSGQNSNVSRQGYESIPVTDALEAPTSTIITSFRAPSIMTEDLSSPKDLEPLTIKQTAKLASIFCIFWFIANWSVNASLDFTSVASSTILSSTSGFFTLLVGRAFHVETMSLRKTCAVLISFAGVVLVSVSDSMSPADSLPTQSSAEIGPRAMQMATAAVGDALALLSAIFYALYVILLKVRIKEESRIDMQLFFGFVGLFNVLMLWPIGIILHLTGTETIEFPHGRKALAAVLVNMLITLSSDYIYVLAMLKTTPLVVTIGLSLTIPLAIIGDFFLKIPSTPQAIFGAILVLGAFVVIGVENSNSETPQLKSRPDGRDGSNIEVEEVEPILEPDAHS